MVGYIISKQYRGNYFIYIIYSVQYSFTLILFFIAIPQFYCMYLYATYVHLNGRAIDIYERITYPETSFFVPNDIEISLLRPIIRQAPSVKA